jgi:hypothetical protein
MEKSRMKRLSAVLLLLFFSIGFARANTWDGIPYIYYYDDYLKGTIIERADGTDSRFVPYRDIEWSTSGRWFVGSIGNEIYRVRADGTQPKQIFERTSSYDYRDRFAPNHDMLAVFDTVQVRTGDNRRWDARMRLVDLTTGDALASLDISDFDTDRLSRYYIEMIYWQPNGAKAFFDIGSTFVVLGVDGAVTFQSKMSYGLSSEVVDKGFTLTWSPSQKNVFFSLIDQMSGQEFNFRSDIQTSPDYTSRYQMAWNEQRTYGLITVKSCNNNECNISQTWVMDWNRKQLRLLPQSFNISYDEAGRPSVTFSPDGRYIFYRDPDYQQQATQAIVDLETQQVTSHSVENLSAWIWSNENILALSAGYINSAETVMFDPTTQLFTTTSFTSYQVFPSPDGKLWGLLTDPPVIKDRASTVIHEWLPHSHSTESYRTPDRYQWHPEGKWVIGEYMIFFAGGGIGPLAGTVFDLAGTVSRELPTDGHAHFLPDNVIPYLAAGQPNTWKPDPVFEISFDSEAVIYQGAFAWHITDSNRFAVYTGSELSYWSLASGTPEMIERVTVDVENLDEVTALASDYPFNSNKQEAQSACLTASSGIYEANTLLTRTETGQEVTRLWTTGAIVAFSADGRWLATVSEPKIQLWDVSAYCS